MEGKAEKTFRNLGKKIDRMIEELADFKENLKNKYGDRWEEVNRNKDKFEYEYQQFRERNKDRFEEAERSLEHAGHEIQKAFEAFFQKNPKNKTAGKATSEESSEH